MNNKKINRIAARLIDNAVFVKIFALLKRKSAPLSSAPSPPFPPKPDAVKKILIIKLEGMGDAVYLIEIIHRLKTKYPAIDIDVLTTDKVPVFNIFASNSSPAEPEFNLIIINPLSFTDYCKTIKAINNTGYDIITDTTGMPVNIPLMLAFAKTSKTYIIGFDTLKIKKSIYDRLENLNGDMHIFENYLKLFKIFNLPQDKMFTLRFTQSAAASTGNLNQNSTSNPILNINVNPILNPNPTDNPNLNSSNPNSYFNPAPSRRIILVLSSNSGGLMHKKLPLAGSVKLIKLLWKEFNGCHISLLGGPGDYNYLEEIKNAADSPPAESAQAESRPAESGYGTPDAAVKIERTKSIEEAMVLLKNSFLNICIDSGLMHLSSLVNPSTYCLFGYSNPANSLPFNNIGYFWSHPDCAPCSFYKISGCDNLKCMDEIDIDAVINDIKQFKNNKHIDSHH